MSKLPHLRPVRRRPLLGSSLTSSARPVKGGGLALPESMFHAALDHNGKGAPLSLAGWGIGNERAGVLGLLHSVMDVCDREVRPHDRLLMRRQRLPDADQRAVRVRRNSGLPKIWVWGAKGETVQTLVQPNQGVNVVADDLQVVNGQRSIPSLA